MMTENEIDELIGSNEFTTQQTKHLISRHLLRALPCTFEFALKASEKGSTYDKERRIQSILGSLRLCFTADALGADEADDLILAYHDANVSLLPWTTTSSGVPLSAAFMSFNSSFPFPEKDYFPKSWDLKEVLAQSCASHMDNFGPLEREGEVEKLLHIFRTEIGYVSEGIDLRKTPLWLDQSMPKKMSSFINDFRKIGEVSSSWRFWSDWYDSLCIGKSVGWRVQRQVALIPSKIWEEGPLAIETVIDEITTRIQLEDRVAELEAVMLQARGGPRGIGDNFPPEPIDEMIWEPLQTLRKEVQSDEPDVASVQNGIDSLKSAMASAAQWSLGLANMAAQEAAKSIGKAAGIATFAWIVLHKVKIEAVIQAATQWLSQISM